MQDLLKPILELPIKTEFIVVLKEAAHRRLANFVSCFQTLRPSLYRQAIRRTALFIQEKGPIRLESRHLITRNGAPLLPEPA